MLFSSTIACLQRILLNLIFLHNTTYHHPTTSSLIGRLPKPLLPSTVRIYRLFRLGFSHFPLITVLHIFSPYTYPSSSFHWLYLPAWLRWCSTSLMGHLPIPLPLPPHRIYRLFRLGLGGATLTLAPSSSPAVAAAASRSRPSTKNITSRSCSCSSVTWGVELVSDVTEYAGCCESGMVSRIR